MSGIILRPERSHWLLWVALVFSTSGYFFLYDRWYLLREVSWTGTFITTVQAWLIWLLLMPWVLQRLAASKTNQANSQRYILNVLKTCLLTLLISTTYQAVMFSHQPGIATTLLFCYVPANLKICALLLLLPTLSGTITLWRQRPESVRYLTCQDHRNQSLRLDTQLISHISADGNYLNIHSQEQVYTLRATLTRMEHTLQSAGFIRCHRSYLINQAHIQQVNGQNIRLNTGEQLPVGRSHLKRIRQLIEPTHTNNNSST